MKVVRSLLIGTIPFFSFIYASCGSSGAGSNSAIVQGQTRPVKQEMRVYMIGNSLTDQVQYRGLQKIAESRSYTHSWARHTVPGSPLELFLENPHVGVYENQYWETTGYDFTNALQFKDWEAVTLQPFVRPLATDIASCQALMDMTRSRTGDCVFYVHAQWPYSQIADWWENGEFDFAKAWGDFYGDREYDITASASFYTQLLSGLRETRPDCQICMIPNGWVLAELDGRIRAGDIPGYHGIIDFWEDAVHLNKAGSYLVASTFFSVIYQEDPRGLPVPDDYGELDPLLVYHIQDAIWKVVTAMPDETGVHKAYTTPQSAPPPSEIPGQYASADARALNATTPPNIDGNPDESSWSLEYYLVKVPEGEARMVPRFGLLWDDTKLYVGIKIKDWSIKNESAEIFVGTGRNRFRIVKTYGSAALTVERDGIRIPADGILQAEAYDAEYPGWSAELAIPWRYLGVEGTAGTIFAFDMACNGTDQYAPSDPVLSCRLSWKAMYNIAESVDRWGTCALDSRTVR